MECLAGYTASYFNTLRRMGPHGFRYSINFGRFTQGVGRYGCLFHCNLLALVRIAFYYVIEHAKFNFTRNEMTSSTASALAEWALVCIEKNIRNYTRWEVQDCLSLTNMDATCVSCWRLHLRRVRYKRTNEAKNAIQHCCFIRNLQKSIKSSHKQTTSANIHYFELRVKTLIPVISTRAPSSGSITSPKMSEQRKQVVK